MIFEKWPFEKEVVTSHIFLIICSFWVAHAQNNKLLIFIDLYLHVVNGVGRLLFAKTISNPSVYFAQPKIELKGLH